MDAVLALSLRQLTSRGRLALLLLLAALPVGLAVLVSLALNEDEMSNQEFIDTLLDGLLIAGVMPLICLVLATTVFGNEVEDRTLNYLVLKPIPKFQIVAAKLLAAVTIGAPIVVASGVISTVIGDRGLGSRIVVLDDPIRGVLAVALALFAGTLAYSAVFMWAGLVTTRALPYGLVYVILWEGVVSSFLGGVRYLSVRGYTLAVMHGLDNASFAEIGDRVIEFPAAIAGVLLVTAGFLWLTVRRLTEMDIP